MVAAFLGGFGNGSDTAFTNFERRDRELQIRVANQRRHELIYGTAEEKQAAAAALSTPAESTPVPAPASTSASA